MPKSNIKLLTKDERKFFKDKYTFIYKDDFLVVKFKDYGRYVAHPINEDFSISSEVRKIKITKEAMKLWKEKFINTDVSVVDVQNAMNALTISYQATNYDDVKNQLKVIEDNDNKNLM